MWSVIIWTCFVCVHHFNFMIQRPETPSPWRIAVRTGEKEARTARTAQPCPSSRSPPPAGQCWYSHFPYTLSLFLGGYRTVALPRQPGLSVADGQPAPLHLSLGSPGDAVVRAVIVSNQRRCGGTWVWPIANQISHPILLPWAKVFLLESSMIQNLFKLELGKRGDKGMVFVGGEFSKGVFPNPGNT